MSIGDALAKLDAGLDEDEAIAMAALEGPASLSPDWDAIVAPYRATHIVLDDFDVQLAGDLKGGVATHIARHDPVRALRQAEAVRKPVEIYRRNAAELDEATQDGDLTYAAYAEGYRDACQMFVAALAGIYIEDQS